MKGIRAPKASASDVGIEHFRLVRVRDNPDCPKNAGVGIASVALLKALYALTVIDPPGSNVVDQIATLAPSVCPSHDSLLSVY